MRKIDLSEIIIDTMTPEGKKEPFRYELKMSIEAILLATGPATTQRLSMPELLRNARIAQKITGCNDGFVLLEENEFQIVKKSFEDFRGFGINDVELCKRIDNAETVEVQEKEKKKT